MNATADLSPLDALAQIGQAHCPSWFTEVTHCEDCGQLWPCETRRILDRVDLNRD